MTPAELTQAFDPERQPALVAFMRDEPADRAACRRELDALEADFDARRATLIGNDPDDPIATHVGDGQHVFVRGTKVAAALALGQLRFLDRESGAVLFAGTRVSQRLLAPRQVELRDLDTDATWIANFAVRELVSFPPELVVVTTQLDTAEVARAFAELRARLSA